MLEFTVFNLSKLIQNELTSVLAQTKYQTMNLMTSVTLYPD